MDLLHVSPFIREGKELRGLRLFSQVERLHNDHSVEHFDFAFLLGLRGRDRRCGCTFLGVFCWQNYLDDSCSGSVCLPVRLSVILC